MPNHVRVKICGIGSIDDLTAAVDAGADAVGVIVGATHMTEDELDVTRARDIVMATPLFVSTVLVTHQTDVDKITNLAEAIGVDAIQAHARLDGDATQGLWHLRGRRRIIRTVHVTNRDSVEEAVAVSPYADALLLDSRTESRLGGTGLTHDWQISKSIVDRVRQQPVILAGGLAADNVRAAIQAVRPYAVDANSRLKDTSGHKDRASCAAFVRAAANSFEEVIGPDR